MLAFIEEGSEPGAAVFLQTCPVIAGSYDPEARVMELTFLCSRLEMERLEECPEVYDELTNAIRIVIPQDVADLRIGASTARPKS